MKRFLRRIASMMLASTMILMTPMMVFATESEATEATEVADVIDTVTNSGISTRAAVINYGTKYISYNSALIVTRVRAAEAMIINASDLFIINPNVPVEIGFKTDAYVKVTFNECKISSGMPPVVSRSVVLFTGAVKDAKISYVPDARVQGYFLIENWSADTIQLSDLYVMY